MLQIPEFHDQSTFCVVPNYLINNRSDKRAFRKDAVKATEFLQWVIDDFIEALFDETVPAWIVYKTIYTHYLDIWNETIQKLGTLKPKLKNVFVDTEFFAKNYAPKV